MSDVLVSARPRRCRYGSPRKNLLTLDALQRATGEVSLKVGRKAVSVEENGRPVEIQIPDLYRITKVTASLV
jgi:hypothetical protein